MLLERPGLEGRPLAQFDDLDGGRLAAVGGDEGGDQDLLALLDGGRPLGELGQKRLRNPGDLPPDLVGMAP